MRREYHKWYSSTLERNMELLLFGHGGTRVLFFPTRKARFFDYENWGIIQALKKKLDTGQLQVCCVDSIDAESFYKTSLHPSQRILRHQQFEQYILEEVLPFMESKSDSQKLIAAGCSLGAYHALNLSFRHPQQISKVVGMSGRYDLTQAMGVFKDLFEGFVDENIFQHTPNKFIPKITDQDCLAKLRSMEIILAVGKEDVFLQDNKFLGKSLTEKNIPFKFCLWDGEAHNPVQWKQMVQLYF